MDKKTKATILLASALPLAGMSAVNDMQLPDGKTCGDCVHYRKCLRLVYTVASHNKECDWSPSRFKDKEGGEG
jgi:hypothetical protein